MAAAVAFCVGGGVAASSAADSPPPADRDDGRVAGELDPSFGDGGFVRTNADGIEHGQGQPSPNDFATAVDIGPRGHIVAGGIIDNVETVGNATVKYRRDGSRAARFDENGIVVGAGADLGSVAGLDVGPRGGVVLVGDSGTPEKPESAVAKLTRHGEPDPRFDSAELDGVLARFDDVAIAGDGSLLITGTTSEGAIAVVKATRSGGLDTSFGDGGVVVAPVSGAVAGVALDADSRIVVAGSAGAGVVAARYGPDGELDVSFGSDGIARMALGPRPLATDVQIDARGRLLISASVRSGQLQLLHGSVVRLLPDGTPDAAFGDGGARTVDLDGRVAGASAVTVDSHHRIVVAGTVVDPQTGRDLYAARWSPDGTADGSFGDDGAATADLSDGHVDEGYDVAVDADDNIVVAGSVDGPTGEDDGVERAFGVARFLGG